MILNTSIPTENFVENDQTVNEPTITRFLKRQKIGVSCILFTKVFIIDIIFLKKSIITRIKTMAIQKQKNRKKNKRWQIPVINDEYSKEQEREPCRRWCGPTKRANGG